MESPGKFRAPDAARAAEDPKKWGEGTSLTFTLGSLGQKLYSGRISELLAPSVRGRQGQTMRNIHSTK